MILASVKSTTSSLNPLNIPVSINLNFDQPSLRFEIERTVESTIGSDYQFRSVEFDQISDSNTSYSVSDVEEPQDIENEAILLKNQIRAWTVSHNIRHSALRDLLKILQNHIREELPLDPRTLMKTPTRVEVSSLCGGHYIYFGVAKYILLRLKCGIEDRRQCFQIRESLDVDNRNYTSLLVGVDGIPLTKSSNKHFWPI